MTPRTLAHIGDPSRGARIASVPGAQLEDFGSGLTPVTQGWFVVNVCDAEWGFSERRGARCAFESEYGDPPVEFAQFGINVTVLEPGRALRHGSALPGVGARGALRRERGGGDLRLEAGVRDGRAFPARAAAELGTAPVVGPHG